MLRKYWKVLMIITVVVSLLSIKGFPIAIGALYLPVLFKIVKLQMKLSDGLTKENVNPITFVKSNQTGVIISVICCIVATFLLMQVLNDFYNGLGGFLSTLVNLSPFTLGISFVLYIFTAIGVVQDAKARYAQAVPTEK